MKSNVIFAISGISLATILSAGCSAESPSSQAECPDASIVHAAITESADSFDLNSIADAAHDYSLGLLGFEEQQAEDCVTSETLEWRIVQRDGEYFPVTEDYIPSRINAVINRGIVAEVSVG